MNALAAILAAVTSCSARGRAVGARARARLRPASSSIAAASAQTATDYKALVCVFLFGGNDGNNTVVPVDTAGYAQYAAVRDRQLGHPARAGVAAADPAGEPGHAVRAASRAGRAAGAVRPAQAGDPRQRRHAGRSRRRKAQYNAGERPLSLYSHSDQQAQWQSAISSARRGHRLGRAHRRQHGRVQRGQRLSRSSRRSTARCCSPRAGVSAAGDSRYRARSRSPATAVGAAAERAARGAASSCSRRRSGNTLVAPAPTRSARRRSRFRRP